MSNSTSPTEAAGTASEKGYTPKKGAPTPKRKESEANLRRPLNAPKTRREAYQQYRERRKRDQGRKRETVRREREAYANGDERYFRPQDRGPVRAYARDYVDSRRSVSEFFLYFSIGIIVLLFLPLPEVHLAITYVVWPMMMLTIVMEGIWTSRQVKRQAAEHFPNESVRGAGLYATMRMLQIRRLRLPKPQLRPGEPVVPRRS